MMLCCGTALAAAALAPIRYGDADGRFPGLPPRTALRPAADGSYTVTLSEELGLAYANEVLQYRLDGLKDANTAAWTLLNEQGKPVPFQLDLAPGEPPAAHLWLLADRLDAGATRRFRLVKRPSAPRSPFTVTEQGSLLEIRNGVTGARVPKSAPITAGDAPGPLQGVLGVSGTWLGRSALQHAGQPTAVESAVTVAGPVRAVVSVRYTFADPASSYQLDMELHAASPAIRVIEQGTFPNADGRLLITFDDWAPDHGIRPNVFSQQVLHDRYTGKAASQLALNNLRPYTGGGWYGLCKDGEADFLSVIPFLGGYWSPGYPVMVACAENGHPRLESYLNVAFHAFMLVPSDARTAIRASAVPADAPVTRTEKPSAVQQALARTAPYGLMYFISSYQLQLLAGCCDPWYYRLTLNDMPLDKTKDWVLTHEDRDLQWPQLFGTRDDWPRMRAKTVPLLEEWQLRQRYLPIDYLVAGQPLTFGDRDHVRDHWEQSWRNDLIAQSVLYRGYAATPYVLTLGQALHAAVRMTDTVQRGLTPEQWTEWKKWALVSGYVLRDREYWWYNWQPGLGTKYLPNFNTCQWASLGLLSVMLPHHPQAAEWQRFARESLEKEFAHHIDRDGVGEENPGNYFPFACDLFFPFIAALQRQGIADYSTHPQFRNAVRYLITILTPPDPRAGGARILPRMGHHPGAGAITTDLGGWAAKLLHTTDPQLAAQAQWAWKQQGGKLAFNHDFPLGLYLADPDLPAAPAPLPSRVVGRLGFVMRNRAPGNDETYFIIKSGPIWSHFQDDEGAFTFYAHGVPLACDGLDLSSRDNQAVNHNVITFNGQGGARGTVKGFAATTVADFGIAELPGDRGYARHVVLVKGAAADEPDYLVLYDRVTSTFAPQWNLDVHSEQPALTPYGVSFPGIREKGYGVGLDVFFLAPEKPTVTLTAGAVDKNYVGHLGTKAHWYARAAARPGTHFLTVLLPFRGEVTATAEHPDSGAEELLPDEPAPARAAARRLHDPRVIEVTWEGGRDLILLSHEPFTYEDGALRFTGRAGVVRLRGNTAALALLDGARLTYGKDTLERAGAIDPRKP